MVVVITLLAAVANAISSVLQRRAAVETPAEDALSLRLIGDLIRRPVWLVAILALIFGFLLQAFALNRGTISEVEPLLIAELPIALLVASAFGGRLRGRDWVAVAAVTFGLAGLLLAAAPSGGNADAIAGWRWLLAGLSAGGLIVLLVLAGMRTRGDPRAALFAAAAGSGFGLTAALMKAATGRLDQSVGAMFASWEIYAMVGCGVASLVVLSNAMQAGRLVAAEPAVTLGDPLISVLLGLLLFGEHVRTGLLLIPEAIGIVLVVAGTIALAHAPHLARSESERDERAPAPAGR